GPPGPPPRPGYPGAQPSFPSSTSWEARQEFNQIQTDPNLTKQQYEDYMNRWANKYGVTDKYDAYKKDIENQTIEAQQELDGALNALPKYFTQLRNIENNMTLTAAQAAQEKKELFKTLTPKQQRAAESLEDIFAPDYAKMPPPRPYGPGPYGPGPYGPGPYGPGPYGPGPYGPGPYGPGPYGTYRPYGSYGHCM
ncbi:hypothetical protein ANCDUO_26083, partial [Ancylostoma duodenale]